MNSFSKQASKYEKGQGLVDYPVVLIVIMVVVIIIILIVKGVNNKKSDPGNEPIATESLEQFVPPAFEGEPVIDIIEMGENTELVTQESIPLMNCNNATEITVDVERKKKFEQKTALAGDVEAGVSSLLVLRLQGYYGLEETEGEEHTYTLHLSALPGKSVEYIIEWRYAVKEGNVIMTNPNGEVFSYPYKVRSNLEFSIVDIIEHSCAETPTVQP